MKRKDTESGTIYLPQFRVRGWVQKYGLKIPVSHYSIDFVKYFSKFTNDLALGNVYTHKNPYLPAAVRK